MRHTVTWHQVTTYSAELEVTIPELAEWAIAHIPIGQLGAVDGTPPRVDDLERSLELNPHLRAALLQLLATETGQAKPVRHRSRQVG